MDKNKLKKILRKHRLWLDGDPNGKRADLSGAKLRSADLRGVDLRGANLRDADLCNADLSGAKLRSADLYNANLRDADLRNADFYDANLYGANLRRADLCNADLSGADLSGADLCNADLRYANFYNANLHRASLRYANLRRAKLCYADLRRADLCNADLREAKYNEETAFFASCCPEKGDFIGYKKASDYIVELLITGRRNSATTRQCRCSEAKVLSITNLDGSAANVTEVCSDRDENFIYKVGETVKVDNFDDNRWNEYSTGIHFFITRDEAVNYEG